MPLDQGREGQLGRLAAGGREPLQELAVGQMPARPDRQDLAELPGDPFSCPNPMARLPAVAFAVT